MANGRIKEVGLERNEIVLSYLHPVKGETEELSFQIDPQTGFSGGFRLEDLQPQEPVSVDYEENSEGSRRAVLIKRVPLRGMPTGHSPS